MGIVATILLHILHVHIVLDRGTVEKCPGHFIQSRNLLCTQTPACKRQCAPPQHHTWYLHLFATPFHGHHTALGHHTLQVSLSQRVMDAHVLRQFVHVADRISNHVLIIHEQYLLSFDAQCILDTLDPLRVQVMCCSPPFHGNLFSLPCVHHTLQTQSRNSIAIVFRLCLCLGHLQYAEQHWQ